MYICPNATDYEETPFMIFLNWDITQKISGYTEKLRGEENN